MPNSAARACVIAAISPALAFLLSGPGIAAGRIVTGRTVIGRTVTGRTVTGRTVTGRTVTGRTVTGRAAEARPGPVLDGFPMIPAGPSRANIQPDASTVTSSDSLNWAGYAVTKSRARFTAVRATFFVPYLNCAKSPGAALSSDWVGFDGFVGHANSVEQGGIAANCGPTGKAAYFAWWEMYPRAEVRAPLRIAAGDSITASVTYNQKTRNYKITVTDRTRGAHFSVQRRCPHVRVGGRPLRCPRDSAEMISEAPVTGRKLAIARLADYGAVSFAAISITDGRGTRGGIVSPHWNATKIIQLRASGGPVVARPTPTAASTFDTYWLRED